MYKGTTKLSTIGQLSKNLELLPVVLAEYENDVQAAADIIAIDKSKLGLANVENVSWQIYYDEKKVELHALSKHLDMLVATARSKLYVSYTQTHDRDLTETGKKIYIDGEPAYLDIQEKSLEVKEMYEKFQAIATAFQSRGYAINNLTKLAIASIEDMTY